MVLCFRCQIWGEEIQDEKIIQEVKLLRAHLMALKCTHGEESF